MLWQVIRRGRAPAIPISNPPKQNRPQTVDPVVRKDSVRCLNYSALILKVKRLFLFSFSNFLDKSNMDALLRVILT
ncbi:MAG: hypothetical protein ACLTXI_05765, partial [Collinsella sp.]